MVCTEKTQEIEELSQETILLAGKLKIELSEKLKEHAFRVSREFIELRNEIRLKDKEAAMLLKEKSRLMHEYQFILLGNFVTPVK
jgi:hypothetical protein